MDLSELQESEIPQKPVDIFKEYKQTQLKSSKDLITTLKEELDPSELKVVLRALQGIK